MQSIWRVYRVYAARYWLWYLGGFLCLFGTNWLSVQIPLEFGKGIDLLAAGGSTAAVVQAAIQIGWMGLGVMVVRTFSRVLIFSPGRFVEHDLRQAVFGRLLVLQKRERLKHSTGDLVSRTANDITIARALVGFGTMQIVNVVVAITLTGREMWRLSPELTLWAALPIVAGALAMQGGVRAVFTLTRSLQESLADLSEQVLASLQGLRVVKSFVAFAAFERRFRAQSLNLLRTGVRLALIGGFFQPLMGVAASVALFFLLYIGGPLAISGEVSVGQIAAFAAYLLFLVPPLRSMVWMISVVQRGRASLERIFAVMDLPNDRPDLEAGPRMVPSGPLGFRIRDLCFAYPSDPDGVVLSSLTVDIPPGKSTGIFGVTGSGKSTLLSVLTRVFNPPPGQVEIVGAEGSADLRTVDLDAYRARIAVVPQIPFLFTDTLAKNVALGTHLDRERLGVALRGAALERDLIQLPQGVETIVGERGILLSGGQRQRAALARALYRDADLFILDDVLASVDHSTEHELVTSLSAIRRREDGVAPTMIVVSHRVSALATCDQIVVMAQGRVIDVGSHRALIARVGPYAEAWRKQAQDDEHVERVG